MQCDLTVRNYSLLYYHQIHKNFHQLIVIALWKNDLYNRSFYTLRSQISRNWLRYEKIFIIPLME